MVTGARFCDAVIGQSLETACRQVTGWRRRDGVPSRDFERRTPKNLHYFAGRHGLTGLTDLGVRGARQAHRKQRTLGPPASRFDFRPIISACSRMAVSVARPLSVSV